MSKVSNIFSMFDGYLALKIGHNSFVTDKPQR